MFRHVRVLAVLFGCAAALLGTAASAASQNAQVKANVLKPLTLVSVQDFDLGILLLRPGTWAATTVGLSRTGVLTCPGPNITCSGTTRPAIYTVTGSNSQPIRVTAPNVVLTNQLDSTKKLTLVVDSPGTVTLPNSGNKGTNFPLGGSISVSSTTASGVYVGTFAVTVDYQ